MSLQKAQDNKIIANFDGSIIDTYATTSNKIIYIDYDTQLPNRILKDGSNNVTQVLDKSQNLAFVQTNPTKQPAFVYGEGFKSDGDKPVFSNFSKTLTDFVIQFEIKWNTIQSINGYTSFFGQSDLNNHCGTRQSNSIALRYDGQLFNGAQYYALQNDNVTPVQGETNKITIVFGKVGGTKVLNLIIDGVTGLGVNNPTQVQFQNLCVFGSNLGATGGEYIMSNFVLIELDPTNNFESYEDIPQYYKPFIYYKRYKENTEITQAYYSTTYIKNAVINTNNQVERLYSQNLSRNTGGFQDPFYSFLYQSVDSKKPIITHEGLVFSSANVTECKATGDPLNLLPDNNFQIGYNVADSEANIMFWHKPTGSKANQYFLSSDIDSPFWVLWNFTANAYTFNIKGVLFSTPANYPIGKFTHIAAFRFSTNWYIYIDGYLFYITGASANQGFKNIQLGALQDNPIYASDCVINDIAFDFKNSYINPTGFSVGQKVFEPPTRSSFEGFIWQHPVGGGAPTKVYL